MKKLFTMSDDWAWEEIGIDEKCVCPLCDHTLLIICPTEIGGTVYSFCPECGKYFELVPKV